MSFDYNSSGLRTKKTVNGEENQYFYSGDLLISEYNGLEYMNFTYGPDGEPVGFSFYDAEENEPLDYYFYLKNLQGDIIGLLDYQGAIYCTYSYDAWGKLLGVYDRDGNEITNPNHAAIRNPLRYRGYYYDDETGLYYLNSRYYNPEWGTFIGADTVEVATASPEEPLYDKSLYAYCDNNPITCVDSSGAIWHIAIGAGVGAVAGLAGQIVSDVVTSALNGGIKISNWQTYLGAIVGGAGGGVVLAATGNVGLSNVATGALTTGIGTTLEKWTISNYDKSWGEIAFNTVVDGSVSYGLGKLPGINKITAGRGNQSAVYRSGLTKLRNGTASKMSRRVVGKGITSSIVGGGALDIYYGVKQYAYNSVKQVVNSVRTWWNKWTK